MATTEIEIAAPASSVYATLMDAWTYAAWVRGAKRIREVDPSWPAPGSRFHHSVGIGPLTTRDETVLCAAKPDALVELEVHVWPAGKGRVRLELEELTNGDGPRTLVRMHEEFSDGPAAWWDNAVQQALMKLRNDWSLATLRKIVEQRYRQG